MKENTLAGPLKRVATIHDLSGFGKCSMTVALPILSAAGLEACCMPTAILSTHTGDFKGFTYRDLTADLNPFMDHWKAIGLKFDAIYSGFLGSPEQVDSIARFIDLFGGEGTCVCVDPAMADSGRLYSVFDDEMVVQMRRLCAKADLLMPNITEGCLLLDRPYKEGPYEGSDIVDMLRGLSALGPSRIVLTGVYFDGDSLGAACYDAEGDQTEFIMGDFVPGQFHGTGDVFGSFLVSAFLNGWNLHKAVRLAVALTQKAILRTVQRGTPLRDGVDFEGVLPEMITRLGLVQQP